MRRLTVFVLGLALLCGAIDVSEAEEIGISGEMGLGVASSFLWRGKVVADNLVIQPDITVVSIPWTVNVWGSWDWETDEDTPVNSRVDVSLLYDQSWKELVFGVGVFVHIYHDSPSGGPKDTYEAYLSVSADVLMNPTVEVFYDFGSVEGAYAKFSAGYSYDLQSRAGLDLRAGIGVGSGAFNEKFYGARTGIGTAQEAPMDEGAFADVTVLLSATIDIGQEFAIVPAIEYVALLDRDLKESAKVDGDDAENIIGSVVVKWYF